MPFGAFRTGFIGAVSATGGGGAVQTFYNATDYTDGSSWHGVDGFTNNLTADNNNMTLSMLIKFSPQDGYNRVFDIGVGPPDGTQNLPRIFCYTLPDNGILYLRYQGPSQREYEIRTDNRWDDGAWHLFTFVFDGSSASNSTVYVDGVDDTFASKTHTGNNIDWDNFDLFGLGTDYDRVNNGYDFNGEIAYVWVDNSVQSHSDFWDSANSRPYYMGTNGVHNTPQPLIYFYGDTSTIATNNGRNDYDITLTAFGTPGDVTDAIEVTGSTRDQIAVTSVSGASIDTTYSKFGGASFETTTANYAYALTDHDFTTATDWTYEFWFRPNASTNKHTIGLSADSYLAGLSFYQNGTNMVVYSGGDAGGWRYNTGAQSGLTVGVWSHIAVVQIGTTWKFFIDGVEKTSATPGGTMNPPSLITLGAVKNNGSFETGQGNIDEVRISKTARYTTGFTPATAPFVNDDNTLILLHMDGTDGSTTFTDDNG